MSDETMSEQYARRERELDELRARHRPGELEPLVNDVCREANWHRLTSIEALQPILSIHRLAAEVLVDEAFQGVAAVR